VRPTLLARAGVGLVVAPPGEIGEPLPPGLTLRYDGPDGRGFAVDGALPRAQVVGACEVVEGAEEALERFVAPDFDPSGSVILERQSGDAPNGCADGAPGAAGTAREVDRSLNSVAFDVRARRAGWLVVNESWDEDWNATIDGRDANVLLGNSVFRAVRVPVGTHVVRFDYVPAAFRVTAVISGAALLLIVVALGLLTIRSTRRRARPD
jgi:hypothetical protein